jgi:hypothetical protein
VFDPFRLRPEASLNRTRLAALRGSEPAWVGQPALDLLSRAAFDALPGDRPLLFGRRLAHLVATLCQPDPEPASSAWRRAYLAHWRTLDTIYLGGGLTAALGQPFIDAARTELARLSPSATGLELAAYPAYMALIGVARSHVFADRAVTVFDFGHSVVKRGIATYAANMLQRLDLLPDLPAPGDGDVVEFFLDTVGSEPTVVSIASYLADDRPLDSHSLYSPVARLERARLSHVTFVHDGTAAARAITDDRSSAAIVLGTALGVGFAPPPSQLAPLSPTFRLAPKYNT